MVTLVGELSVPGGIVSATLPSGVMSGALVPPLSIVVPLVCALQR